MLEKIWYPQSLAPTELDTLLSCGWFRMGQSIFTTEYVMFSTRIYRTIWLRHVLKDYRHTRTYINLKKRNRHFRIELKKVHVTPAHEALFDLYKSSVYFEAAASLYQLLDGYVYEPVQIYNTYEINIYDKDKLIACSYFDIGEKSAEGISAYYDPAYRSHSLGRYMIYLQVELCKGNGFDYYYPGYFVPGFSHLDYKLDIGTHCLEFLDPADVCWYPIADYLDEGIPIGLGEYFADAGNS